eukprot:TRINITY_DN23863_c0_g1_i1.p2 TRINITY_DN23863_c0_g1~~TRINITY_DN23863_c0_g1_i1.p2  ORF type:complete len:159 (-),score=20.85 TRINITY_DN23863_c0_g1_i1:165-641(-)
MSSLCLDRLAKERKDWRKEHPPEFFARPRNNEDGSANMLIWDCGIPGKAGTPWEGGVYPLTVYFEQDYPVKPPICQFPKGFFHPNVFPEGQVCLSILKQDEGWSAGISVKQVLLGIQELLNTPNIASAAQEPAFYSYTENRADYEKRVRAQAKKYPPE